MAREISPGFGICPPPISETADAVWCGALKGGFVISALSSKRPDMEEIFVTSIASSKSSYGRIVGNLFAAIVFPEPGEPSIKIFDLAQAEISRALFKFSCPLMSEKSTS